MLREGDCLWCIIVGRAGARKKGGRNASSREGPYWVGLCCRIEGASAHYFLEEAMSGARTKKTAMGTLEESCRGHFGASGRKWGLLLRGAYLIGGGIEELWRLVERRLKGSFRNGRETVLSYGSEEVRTKMVSFERGDRVRCGKKKGLIGPTTIRINVHKDYRADLPNRKRGSPAAEERIEPTHPVAKKGFLEGRLHAQDRKKQGSRGKPAGKAILMIKLKRSRPSAAIA